MKPRKTRPNTLTNTVRIRVTQQQHDALMNLAHDRHLTFSDYARRLLLNDIEKTHAYDNWLCRGATRNGWW